jgi:ribosomal protein S18 acetylase RimI-like enzyme
MITYKRCSEVDMDLIFNAFSIGFSDYIIKHDMPKDIFVKIFFGPEGNTLESSFIALEDNRPVGVVLSGIKEYEGIKTIRCGTLAVDPEYRGKGVSKRLMELHKEEGINNGCKQLFLEVIVSNERAVNFYKKLNYDKIYDLVYFSLSDIHKLKEKDALTLEIKVIDIETVRKSQERIEGVHLNWQNDMEYIEKSEGQSNLGAYANNKLVGVVSVNKSTRLNYIWVENSLRHKGVATRLLVEAAKELNLSKLSSGFPNNASLEGFLKHIGFERDKISQYEMYYTITEAKLC